MRLEHERWLREMLLCGWQAGPSNHALRLMVPYDELDPRDNPWTLPR
jgi:hypothetical protein